MKEKKQVTFREASLSTSLLWQLQAGTSPSPAMAGGDPSSHGRAGPGPGLLLGIVRCPLPNSVQPWVAAPSQGSDSALLWDGRDHVALPTHGPRATAAVGTQARDLKNPNQAGGRQFSMDLRGANMPAPLLAYPTPCLAPGVFSVPKRALGDPCQGARDTTPVCHADKLWPELGPAEQDSSGDCKDLPHSVYYLNSQCLFSGLQNVSSKRLSTWIFTRHEEIPLIAQ